MSTIMILASMGLAFTYMARLEHLRYGLNELSFVLAQALTAGMCVACAYQTFTQGLSPLTGFVVATAAAYLFRSRDTYHFETSKPAPLDELDDHDLTDVYGRGDR